MVVKVQISQFSSDGKTQMLVYNKARTVKYEGEPPAGLLTKMNGSPKQFFHSEVKNGERILLAVAPWQNW